VCSAADPDPKEVVAKVVKAAGGEDKLLKLFRIKEKLVMGEDPKGKATDRVSVLEPPTYWWMGKKERVKDEKEPATFLVWAWTLGAITDKSSTLQVLPDLEDDGAKLKGLRVSQSITPAMDLYFDPKTYRLTRIDWRTDTHRFSEWKEHDGVSYPARCVGYKTKSGKAWYHSEIVELERLKELPDGLKR
jgi:hypothetical protein